MAVLTPEQQRELFKGCVYLPQKNRVRIPSGMELDQKRFNVEYGGHQFPYGVKAWHAFTRSRPPIA